MGSGGGEVGEVSVAFFLFCYPLLGVDSKGNVWSIRKMNRAIWAEMKLGSSMIFKSCNFFFPMAKV